MAENHISQQLLDAVACFNTPTSYPNTDDHFGNLLDGLKSVGENVEEVVDEEEVVEEASVLIDKLKQYFNDYPKLIKVMLAGRLLRRRQNCKKCQRVMKMRRRKDTYEWRCRFKKSYDCSSCSIKYGSWFENTKLPFNTIFRYLLMHCSSRPSVQIMKELNITSHTVIELRKVIYELSSRICQKYPKIGGRGQECYVEEIEVNTKKNSSKHSMDQTFRVLAGQMSNSNQCFIRVLNGNSLSDVEKAKWDYIADGTLITTVTTVNDCQISINPDSTTTSRIIKIFNSLRKPVTESSTLTPKLLQDYMDDLVVQQIEQNNYLNACIDEIRAYV